MAILSVTVIIQRPVEEIFPFISNYQNDWKWRSRRIDFQNVNELDPANFVATQRYIPLLRHKVNNGLKVIDFSINEHIISQIQFGKIMVTDERRFFSPNKHLTRFEYNLKIELSGISKILEQLLTRRLYQDIITDINWLKEMLEELTIPHPLERITNDHLFDKTDHKHLFGLT